MGGSRRRSEEEAGGQLPCVFSLSRVQRGQAEQVGAFGSRRSCETGKEVSSKGSDKSQAKRGEGSIWLIDSRKFWQG